jgi:hypothetical protein
MSQLRAPGELGRWTGLVAAVILPIGPAAIAILRFVLPYYTVDEPPGMAAKVAADLGSQSLVVWLGLIAVMTTVPAVIWIGRLTFRGAPALTAVALALAVPGYLALGLIMAGDVLLWTGIHTGLEPEIVADLLANSHPAIGVAEGIFVLGHVLGTILLGLALWRSRVVARWAAGMTAISQPIHLIAAVFLLSPPLDLAAWMMTAVGFAAAGIAISMEENAWGRARQEHQLPKIP